MICIGITGYFCKESHVKKIIYTTTLGFSLGIFTCYFLNFINDSDVQHKNVNYQHKSNSINTSIFLSNAQKNVSEDDGGFFTPSPHVEESIIENDFQDV